MRRVDASRRAPICSIQVGARRGDAARQFIYKYVVVVVVVVMKNCCFDSGKFQESRFVLIGLR